MTATPPSANMSFVGEKTEIVHHTDFSAKPEHTLIDDNGISARLTWINLWSCGGAMSYGFSVAIIASSLGQPNLYAYFGESLAGSNAPVLISTIVGMYNVGGLFASFATGAFSDRFGRKASFAFAMAFIWLGTVLCVAAQNVAMLMMGRFFSGAGGWSSIMSSIIYAAECAPATRRGLLAGAIGPSVTIGYIIASFVGLGFFYSTSTFNWRAAFLLQIFPTLFILGGLPFVPESPRWLAMVGRDADALDVLKKIHYNVNDPTGIIPREEHYQIIAQDRLDKTLPSGWYHLFTTYWKRTFVACLVCVANQSTGIQIITNYGPVIYSSLGLSPSMCLVIAVVWLLTGIPTSFICIYLLDRVGRRPLLIWSTVACGVFIAILATLIGVYKDSDSELGKRACVGLFFVFLVGYEFNEPVMFLYIGEVIPTHLRNKGVALALGFINLWSIWITESQPVATAIPAIGAKYYAIFPILCLFCAIAQWFVLVETKNTSLEEIAGLFGDENQVAVHAKDITIDAQGNVIENHHV